MSLPRPRPMVEVAHSPTPSRVRMAASSKGRGVKGAGRVGQVVLGEKQGRDPAIPGLGQFVPEERAHHQLFLDPHRHGHEEAPQAPGGEAVVGLQQPLELEVGLVVKGHRGRFAQLEAPASAMT